VPIDPRRLLRGLGKLVAVVLLAGLAGAGIGIGLAKLTADDASSAPIFATTSATLPAVAQATGEPAATTTVGAQPSAPVGAVYRVPRVQILAAQLDSGAATGGAGTGVTARVRVTNRGSRPLTIKAPVLLAGADEVALDTSGGAPGPLLAPIAAGASATGTLRFATSAAQAQRLRTTSRARLRIGNRTVALVLTPSNTGATTG
jgi:pyruvate/2-oxoglutarate dehydrogenase complex dihydrolipoamide acyltransferase (E2) component